MPKAINNYLLSPKNPSNFKIRTKQAFEKKLKKIPSKRGK